MRILQLSETYNPDGYQIPLARTGENARMSVNTRKVYICAGVDNYTLTVNGVSSYYDGLKVFAVFNDNTGEATINMNGLGAKPILKRGGSPLQVGDIVANTVYELIYFNDAFRLMSTSASAILPVWGSIVGTLSNQTDLKSELDRIENLIGDSEL